MNQKTIMPERGCHLVAVQQVKENAKEVQRDEL